MSSEKCHTSMRAVSAYKKTMESHSLEIRVKGIVQGVGFRPFVYRLATRLSLKGSIANTSSGVIIKITGRKDAIDTFLEEIHHSHPPLARIQSLEISAISSKTNEEDFQIKESSREGSARTRVSPDTATCSKCVAEIMDKKNRRFDYAFTNCTDCGPRYTITRSLPYDRQNTSMKVFDMCERCLAEYRDPLDRRFHAQPNACHDCGPRLFWQDATGIYRDRPIDRAVTLLKGGGIIALKGLGGFHIAATALLDGPVETLRARKKRPFKPLAVMVKDLATAKRLCHVSTKAGQMLSSPWAPICILPKRAEEGLSDRIAPGLNELGIMLPYTPIHHLLFARNQCPEALIMTSGNPRGEPLCTDNQEALHRLKGFVDGFLLHDRDIYTGIDDSVVRIVGEKVLFVRRSRGFVPAPVELAFDMAPGLAVGAELKNTFCLFRTGEAFVSQHIGNLTNLSVLEFFQQNIEHMKALLEISPGYVVADLHPDYLSTRFAEESGLPVYRIQHHFAHAASVMAEHGIDGKVLALVLDGAGFGTDNTIWGGEILECSPNGFLRLARLSPFPLPGGDMAARQPWRLSLALLYAYRYSFHDLPDRFRPHVSLDKMEFVAQMIKRPVNTPLTSSCGRLFDAVSALIGLCYENSYEAQGAMMLEALCEQALMGRSILETREFSSLATSRYLWAKGDEVAYEIDWRMCLERILEYEKDGRNRGETSILFHAFLIAAFSRVLVKLKEERGISKVVLSGGCMQNRILVEGLLSYLEQMGLKVYINEQVPANDGGISLGQALIGAKNYEVSKCA